MLSCRRVGQRAALCQGLGRRWETTSSAPSASHPIPSISPYQHPHLNHAVGRRSLALRCLDEITSPLDALAIVRTVERRFGRVAEYRFQRDMEVTSRYQYLVNIAFWDPAAYSRVPKGPIVLQTALSPDNPNLLPGGVGLADVAPFLEAKDWTDNDLTEEFKDQPLQDGSRIIQFRVEHFNRFQKDSVAPPEYVQRFDYSLSSSFVRWGGFAPIQPIENPVISQSELVFGNANVDHPHMRHVVKLMSSRHALKDPYQTSRTRTSAPSRSSKPARAAAPPASDAPELLLDSIISPPITSLPAAPAIPPSQPQATETTAEVQPIQPQMQAEATQSTLQAEVTAERVEGQPPAAEATAEVQPAQAPTQAEATQSPLQAKVMAEAKEEAAEPETKSAPQPEKRTFPVLVTERSQVRAARGVSVKIKTGSPAKAAAPKAAVAQSTAKTSAKPAKKKKKEGSKPQEVIEALSQRPIEVEERTPGMTERLKGLFGGWGGNLY
ncbi:hypothetical protein B0H17DRAFT_1332747 [Mycena rosella]|uniref:Uncharacterized protein n=1 Tax=Mycena rosella TaxID=1033263 RepID=A0AAD7DD46_MYCRO|nr:hypothetical protein B0H17DRAFT_1332747 [Mycena rosella]